MNDTSSSMGGALGKAAGRGWSALISGVRAVENSPVGPRTVAEHWLTRRSRIRRARAGRNPEWAAIEARRRTGRGSVVMLSSDLSIADWGYQRRLANSITPESRSERLARQIKNISVEGKLRGIEHLIHRARHGWSDSDVWSLHHTHERVLGEQLIALADMLHGWPDSLYDTPEEWEAALRHHGKVLTSHGWSEVGISEEESLNTWHDLASEHSSDPAEIKAASERMREAEAGAAEAVKTSLHWVAEVNGHLWD